MKIKTEAELCKLFIDAHPRKEHLYFEVYIPGGRCDMIHKETSIVTIYEAKLRLNIDLLEQCINRKPYAHFVYAVVPEKVSRRNTFLESLFKDYGIGTIMLRDDYSEGANFLNEIQKPTFNRHPKSITIYEENKKEIAGMQNGGITPFQIMVNHIKQHLSKRGESTIDEVFKQQHYYGALKQFKTNIYQWIRAGVIKGIEMEKGKMRLTNERTN